MPPRGGGGGVYSYSSDTIEGPRAPAVKLTACHSSLTRVRARRRRGGTLADSDLWAPGPGGVTCHAEPSLLRVSPLRSLPERQPVGPFGKRSFVNPFQGPNLNFEACHGPDLRNPAIYSGYPQSANKFPPQPGVPVTASPGLSAQKWSNSPRPEKS